MEESSPDILCTLEELLLLARKGDTNALHTLRERVFSKKHGYINAALVEIPHLFSLSDREYVYEQCLNQAIGTFCVQVRCSFLNYFINLMHYAFCNLGKTYAEYVSSIGAVQTEANSKLLHDCNQKDDNDLMKTLFTWKNDIMALAKESTYFTKRDLRVVSLRLANTSFKNISKKTNCSLSTCKKVWKKFLDFARDILEAK